MSKTDTTALPKTKSGFAAIIGAPNAGKSTLVNALVGEKVTIVTHKVQTTRFQVRGIAMIDNAELGIDGDDVNMTQIVLVDTPGIFEAKERLDRSMVHAAWTGADDADAVVHVVDAPAHFRALTKTYTPQSKGQDNKGFADTARVVTGLKKRGKKTRTILALNKIDQIDHEDLLSLITEFDAMDVYQDVFLISATSGKGVDRLKRSLVGLMPLGPYLFPADQAADMPVRLIAAEVTREKLYLRLHDELPYASMVETEKWTDQKNGDVRIDQVIYVKRESQKPIVLGKGGKAIRDIGTAARKDLEDMLGCKVHLFIFVKVRENWTEDRARYQETGLEFDV